MSSTSIRPFTGHPASRHCRAVLLAVGFGFFACSLTGCGKADTANSAAATAPANAAAPSPVQVVTKLLTGLGSNDPAALAAIDTNRYTQHNLAVRNGIEGTRAYLAAIPPGKLAIKPVRVFQDGEFVVAQSEVSGPTPRVEFDVFRFADDKIIEHWDNIADHPTAPNTSGHTVVDGPTAVTDEADTAKNKIIARDFVTQVLIHEKLDAFDNFFDGDKYIQHDPFSGDGASGLKNAIGKQVANNSPIGYDTIQKVIGRGNFVLVMSSGSLALKPTAFYDLFRLENGKLAEHWAVVQEIPNRLDWQNANGKF